MQCYEAGQVFVLPVSGDADQLQNRWADRRDVDRLDIIYSVRDILSHYDISTHDLLEQFGAFPFVARVPEGEEREYAARYRSDPDVSVAIPNFHINPLQEIPTINHEVLSAAIDSLKCAVGAPEHCGRGVKVAVIDTGVAAEILPFPKMLHDRQYATDSSSSMSNLKPHDPVGHGSTIAYIINNIAPSATIMSIKMMEKIGNVGGLISAIYLAEADFRPDIYNLSLSLACDVDVCGSCGSMQGSEAAVTSAQLQLLFEIIDKREKVCGNKPLLVAAAGNNSKHVRMPARFPNVLAVGSYDMSSLKIAPYSNYDDVPEDRFIVAPGGYRDQENCIAYKPKNIWDRTGTFYGTSFSTAFVTAIAARYLCATKDSPCGLPGQGGAKTLASGRKFLMDCLTRSASRNLEDFTSQKYGFGIVQYNMPISREVLGEYLTV